MFTKLETIALLWLPVHLLNDVSNIRQMFKNAILHTYQCSNKTRGSQAITKIMVPTRQQLKELLGHGDAKSRALFFVLLSSGMTIGEACKIKLDDVKLTEEPVRIIIKKEL